MADRTIVERGTRLALIADPLIGRPRFRRAAGAPAAITRSVHTGEIAQARGARLAIGHLARVAGVVACVVGTGAGCGGEDATGARTAPSGSASPGRAAPSASASTRPAAPQSASPREAPAPATSASALTGAWKGSYNAEKVTPTLDPTVMDEVWKGDDGKRHAGAGRIELTVTADGLASGTIEGALGRGDIHGAADDGVVRAVVAAAADDGPSGTLIARPSGKGLSFEVRTSDGEGRAPRIAKGTLEKAP